MISYRSFHVAHGPGVVQLGPPPRDKRGVKWTDALDRELRRMWRNGLLTAQIAEALPSGISKNAVIGRARRLELPIRGPGRRAA